MSGRYFFLQNPANDLVLDIPGSDASAGAIVKMWSHHGGDNQLWYEDPVYNTIRPRIDDNLVLDINDDNRLILNDFDDDNPNQKWQFSDDRVQNVDSGKVLDVARNDDDEGAEVCMWDWHGGENQIFEVNYEEAKEFIIKSKMNGKALDVQKKCDDAGTPVVMYDQHGKDNQVWYESKDGLIHTKLNGYVLSSDDGTFQIQPYDGSDERQWVRVGDRIINKADKDLVMDIKRSDDDNGAELGPWSFHGSDNQLWEYEWV